LQSFGLDPLALAAVVAIGRAMVELIAKHDDDVDRRI
jgi:hypothetical protein